MFNLLQTLELTFFGFYFQEFTPSISSLFQSWLKNGRHTLKNTTQVEIIITINAENYAKYKSKVFCYSL